MDLSASFEEMMQRSPISQHDMKNFLRDMRRTPSGTVVVSKLLAAKIQSDSEAQSIQAFEFLEAALESESEGSIEFRTEIGRYRFLNEIIRILSPKYLGDNTPEPVKERATKFLEDAAGSKRRRWFPSEHSKVNSVYQSLVESGIIAKPNRIVDEDAEFQKSIFERGENAAILKRLLQSKDPSDLQAANRLIKNLVDEEARRNERRAELHSLIDRIETSTGLLTEMLNQRNIDKEIVDELVDTCRSLRQKLGDVATETSDEVTSLLQASENIEKVLLLYDAKKESIGKQSQSREDENETRPECSDHNKLSLADELLMNLGDEEMKDVIQQEHQNATKSIATGEDLLNLDIDLASTGACTVTKSFNSTSKGDDQIKCTKPDPVEPFHEIGQISREMMEQGLKGAPNLSQSKKTDRTPLSHIRKQSPPHENTKENESSVQSSLSKHALRVSSEINSSNNHISLLDLDYLDKPSSSKATKTSGNLSGESESSAVKPEGENLLLDLESQNKIISDSRYSNGLKIKNDSSSFSTKEKDFKPDASDLSKNVTSEIKNITNSNTSLESKFCLNSVREIDLENIELLEELKPLELRLEDNCKDVGLTVTFGKYPEFPSSVSVAIITLTNRNKQNGLLNYVFQLLPPKGLQVKLLPPATMELPPWKKTFLPPPILTQVALILSKSNTSTTNHAHLKIKFILSFCVEEETILHNGDFTIPACLL